MIENFNNEEKFWYYIFSKLRIPSLKNIKLTFYHG